MLFGFLATNLFFVSGWWICLPFFATSNSCFFFARLPRWPHFANLSNFVVRHWPLSWWLVPGSTNQHRLFKLRRRRWGEEEQISIFTSPVTKGGIARAPSLRWRDQYSHLHMEKRISEFCFRALKWRCWRRGLRKTTSLKGEKVRSQK